MKSNNFAAKKVLMRYTSDILRRIAVNYQLPTNGNKRDLVERIAVRQESDFLNTWDRIVNG